MNDEITQTPEVSPPTPSVDTSAVDSAPEAPVENQPPHTPVKILTVLEVLVAVVLVGGSFWWWTTNRPVSTSNFVPLENSSEAEEIMDETYESGDVPEGSDQEFIEDTYMPGEDLNEEPSANSIRTAPYLGSIFRFLLGN